MIHLPLIKHYLVIKEKLTNNKLVFFFAQVNLPTKHRITSITIQGRNDSSPEYVKSFMIEYSSNGWDWFTYKIDGRNKVIQNIKVYDSHINMKYSGYLT